MISKRGSFHFREYKLERMLSIWHIPRHLIKCICSCWRIKSFESNFIAQCRVTEEAATQRDEIKCCMGCEPDVNPQLQKRHGKAYYYIEVYRGPQPPFTKRVLSISTRTPNHEYQGLDWILTQQYRCRKTEVRLVVFFSLTVALCRCEALQFVPLKFRGIYANVEQNGWSELVIHESSKESESLDMATHTRLLPAFWMTSWLFIPLDFLPPFFSVSLFIFSLSYQFSSCLLFLFC